MAYATDAPWVFGRRARRDTALCLHRSCRCPADAMQHEHAMVALDEALSLPRRRWAHRLCVRALPAPPGPSSAADLHRLDAPRRQLPTLAVPSSGAGRAVVASLFHNAAVARARPQLG